MIMYSGFKWLRIGSVEETYALINLQVVIFLH